MFAFIVVILLILAVLLTVVVLLQPGKGDITASMGGLSGQFTSMFGSRRAMDLLTKMTIGFAIAIFVLILLTNLFFLGGESEGPRAVTEGVELPATPATPFQVPQAPPQQPGQ